MSTYIDEFKEFISKGNVMDMAIGFIIGGAFTSIVTALTDNIVNPLITFITGGGTDMAGSLVVPGTNIDFGALISAIINFLIVAFIVFNLVKAINKAQTVAGIKLEEEEESPICPSCLEEVKEGATRCPHCGSEIPGGARL